jgi:hypothetical protein
MVRRSCPAEKSLCNQGRGCCAKEGSPCRGGHHPFLQQTARDCKAACRTRALHVVAPVSCSWEPFAQAGNGAAKSPSVLREVRGALGLDKEHMRKRVCGVGLSGRQWGLCSCVAGDA